MAAASVLPTGVRVRVIQKVRVQDRAWSHAVEGVVLAHRNEPTGSWYAHGKDDRYWLSRLRLRKEDGEITALVLDDSSVVTQLSSGASAPLARAESNN